MRKSELQGLEVKEVSLVDRAANKRKFLMLKNAGGDQGMHDIVKELLETEAIDEGKLKEITKCLSPEAEQAAIGALRLLQGFSDEIPMDVYTGLMKLCCDGMGDMGEGDGMDEDIGEGDAVSAACKTKKPAAMEKADEQIDKAVDAPLDQEQQSKTMKQEGTGKMEKVDIFKSDGTINMEAVPEEMKESVEKLFKQMTDAQAMVKKAEDDKLTAEYIEKAKELKNIAQKPEEFGVILKQISQAAPEQAKVLYEILKAADVSLGKAGLFAEIGSTGGGEPATAWDKIEKSAEAMAAKEKITKAEAVSKILDENPALYNDYLNEKKGAK